MRLFLTDAVLHRLRGLAAAFLLISLVACGGGSSGGGSQGSSTPSLVSIEVTPASPSVNVGSSQQFTATGTFSDNSTQDLTSTATWSSSSPAVATVSSAGVASGVATGTATISAASGSVNGSSSLTITTVPVQISSLSETTANPFDSLTITGKDFTEGTLAISVLFVPENGDLPVLMPASASSASSVQVMVPTFASSSGAFSAETVDVQVVQFSAGTTYLSNRLTGLQVNSVPSAGSAPAGALTAALLTSALNISTSAQTGQSANTNFANTSAALVQLNADLAPLISAVETVVNNPGQTANIQTANGATTALNAQTLALSDQLAQALIAAIVSQGSIPAATSSSGCPAATGNATYDSNLCSVQSYFQTLATQAAATPASLASRHSKHPVAKLTVTPPDKAVLTIYANLVLGSLAEACEPAGGGAIYELVAAPIVTGMISSLAVNQETPPGEDIVQGVGLNFLDNAFFAGLPILGTSVDEINAAKTIITWSPPKKGVLLSSGAAGFMPNEVTFLDPNTNEPTTLLKVPDQPQAGTVDSTTLVVPPQAEPYTLNLSMTGAGTGSINSFPSGTSFPAGTVVGLTAAPASGSTFAGWSGPCSGTGICTVTMNSNQTVTADFEVFNPSNGVTFNGAASGNGSYSSSCSTTFSGTIQITSPVALTPYPGGIAGSWQMSGTLSGSGSGCSFTQSYGDGGDANFNVGSNGSVTLTLGGSDCSFTGSGTTQSLAGSGPCGAVAGTVSFTTTASTGNALQRAKAQRFRRRP